MRLTLRMMMIKTIEPWLIMLNVATVYGKRPKELSGLPVRTPRLGDKEINVQRSRLSGTSVTMARMKKALSFVIKFMRQFGNRLCSMLLFKCK